MSKRRSNSTKSDKSQIEETVETIQEVQVDEQPVIQEEVIEQKPPVISIQEFHAKEEPKKEEVKVETPSIPQVKEDIKLGSNVRIKEGANKTANMKDIPDFAFKNKYRVIKVIDEATVVLNAIGGFHSMTMFISDLQLLKEGE